VSRWFSPFPDRHADRTTVVHRASGPGHVRFIGRAGRTWFSPFPDRHADRTTVVHRASGAGAGAGAPPVHRSCWPNMVQPIPRSPCRPNHGGSSRIGAGARPVHRSCWPNMVQPIPRSPCRANHGGSSRIRGRGMSGSSVVLAERRDEEPLDPHADPRLDALAVARHVERADLLGLDPGRDVRRAGEALDHQVGRSAEPGTGPERRPASG
jgi:hypothetical protein